MKTVHGYNVIATQEELNYALQALGDDFTKNQLESTIEEFRSAKIKVSSELEKSLAKKTGKPYTLNGKEYIVPLDKDAQDTVTAVSVAYIAGLFVSTTMEFSNGVKMPIVSDDWIAFAQWFVAERNSFFEVAP